MSTSDQSSSSIIDDHSTIAKELPSPSAATQEFFVQLDAPDSQQALHSSPPIQHPPTHLPTLVIEHHGQHVLNSSTPPSSSSSLSSAPLNGNGTNTTNNDNEDYNSSVTYASVATRGASSSHLSSQLSSQSSQSSSSTVLTINANEPLSVLNHEEMAASAPLNATTTITIPSVSHSSPSPPPTTTITAMTAPTTCVHPQQHAQQQMIESPTTTGSSTTDASHLSPTVVDHHFRSHSQSSSPVTSNLTVPSPCASPGGTTTNHAGSSTKKSPQNENWPWIEQRKYIEGDSLLIDEGNRLDFKLTVFSDYLNYKAAPKKKKPSSGASSTGSNNSGNDAFDFIDYSKLGLRMIEYLIAFLNSNGGCLLFGVSDDSIVMGMKLTEKQRDKIRLVFDNCIRNFSVTPQPITGVDYRLEFIPVLKAHKDSKVNELGEADVNKSTSSKVVLAMEVRKSKLFHYAHISKQLKSWERLNASNVCLNEHPFRFVKRLQELKSGVQSYDSGFEDHQSSIVLSEDTEFVEKYITLLFSDIVLYCSERILATRGRNTRMYRLEEWSILDDKGRFVIDRPSKYFKWLYDYLQIGMISVPISEYFILISEANFYNLLELVPNSGLPQEQKATKKVAGGYVTLISPGMAELSNELFSDVTEANQNLTPQQE